jgi:DNA-binding MarR family transcriptional regulator
MKIKKYLQDSPIFALYEVSNVLTSSLNLQLSKEDLSFTQALVLVAILLDEKTKITPGEIANGLGISKASLSQILSNLESRGYLKRTIKEDDARSLCLSLSTLGLKKANRIVKFLDSFELDLEKNLNLRKEFLLELQEFKNYLTASNLAKS